MQYLLTFTNTLFFGEGGGVISGLGHVRHFVLKQRFQNEYAQSVEVVF